MNEYFNENIIKYKIYRLAIFQYYSSKYRILNCQKCRNIFIHIRGISSINRYITIYYLNDSL